MVKNVKQLNNAAGYVLRLRHGASVIYCVKKANADWATRKKKGMMNIFFTEAGLDIMDSPSFSIARSFDFFVVGENVFITNKPAFESLLSHNDTYEEAYVALKQEPGFSAAIANLAVFDAFIGKNATHLRRMAVIKARGYYNNLNYMTRLREINALRGWGIQFDEQGRIEATQKRCVISCTSYLTTDYVRNFLTINTMYHQPPRSLIRQHGRHAILLALELIE